MHSGTEAVIQFAWMRAALFVWSSMVQCTFAQTAGEPDLQRFDRLIELERYEEALPALEVYGAEHPESARAHYQLGYTDYRVHRIEASVKALSRSLVLNPKNADAHRILGYDLTILHRLDLAAVEFQRAAALQPGLAENHYALGRVY